MSSSTKAAFTNAYTTVPGLYSTVDLSAAQFKLVYLKSTGGQIGLVATSVLLPAITYGVLMNNPKGTSALPVNAEVAVQGIVKAIAGTAVVVKGSMLTGNTTGRLVPTTTDNAPIVAKALQASSTNGDIITVELIPGGTRY